MRPITAKAATIVILKLSLGEGLLTSDGAFWQRQRKMTQPAFHSTEIAGFVRIMEKHALAMMEQWQTLAASGETFDVLPHLMRFTLNIVSEALFSTNVESDIAVIRDTLDVGREYRWTGHGQFCVCRSSCRREEICNINVLSGELPRNFGPHGCGAQEIILSMSTVFSSTC